MSDERMDLQKARVALGSLDRAVSGAPMNRGDHVTAQNCLELLVQVIEENAMLRQLLDGGSAAAESQAAPTKEASDAENVEQPAEGAAADAPPF